VGKYFLQGGKEMKKIVLAAILLVLGVALVSAIDISVSARGGYGLGLGGQNFFGMTGIMDTKYAGEELEIDAGGETDTYTTVNFSNGKGIKLLAGVDLGLLPNFSVELLGGYVIGPEQDAYSYEDASAGPDLEGATMKTSYLPLSLTAKAKIPLGKFTLFAGAGPSFALFAKTTSEMDSDNGVNVTHQEMEMTYKPGFGYHGVLGAEYALTGNLSLLFEVRGEQLTFKPKKAEITAWTENGTDVLSTHTTSETEIEFVDDLADYRNGPMDPDDPSERNAVNINGNSVSVYLGVIWRF
jgi:opacity protein-like surface antigen